MNESEIQKFTNLLLLLVREKCWNEVSNNCLYILSNISDFNGGNFHEQRKSRKEVNEKKKPQSIQFVSAELEQFYNTIYDLNFYVYKSEKEQTVIEIQYFLKEDLDFDYRKTVSHKLPMVHCKINNPYYRDNDEDKFDINWELNN